MRPMYSTDDRADIHLANTKFLSERLLADTSARKPSPNLAHVVFREFRATILRSTMAGMTLTQTFGSAVSALSDRIVGIVLMSAKEQVRRVTAGWVVAMVTHLQSSWNWSDRQYVCKTMSLPDRALITELAVTLDATSLEFETSSSRPFQSLPEVMRLGSWWHIGSMLTPVEV